MLDNKSTHHQAHTSRSPPRRRRPLLRRRRHRHRRGRRLSLRLHLRLLLHRAQPAPPTRLPHPARHPDAPRAAPVAGNAAKAASGASGAGGHHAVTEPLESAGGGQARGGLGGRHPAGGGSRRLGCRCGGLRRGARGREAGGEHREGGLGLVLGPGNAQRPAGELEVRHCLGGRRERGGARAADVEVG